MSLTSLVFTAIQFSYSNWFSNSFWSLRTREIMYLEIVSLFRISLGAFLYSANISPSCFVCLKYQILNRNCNTMSSDALEIRVSAELLSWDLMNKNSLAFISTWVDVYYGLCCISMSLSSFWASTSLFRLNSRINLLILSPMTCCLVCFAFVARSSSISLNVYGWCSPVWRYLKTAKLLEITMSRLVYLNSFSLRLWYSITFSCSTSIEPLFYMKSFSSRDATLSSQSSGSLRVLVNLARYYLDNTLFDSLYNWARLNWISFPSVLAIPSYSTTFEDSVELLNDANKFTIRLLTQGLFSFCFCLTRSVNKTLAFQQSWLLKQH